MPRRIGFGLGISLLVLATSADASRTPDPRVASAFLAREAEPDAGRVVPPAEERLRLRLHFSVVIDRLRRDSDVSLDVAVSRLEARAGDRWSGDERAARRAALAAERWLQVERLRAYRDRGLFPLNHEFPSAPVPIFVDDHGTPCAVGHLMQLAGLQNAVQDIAERDRYVYVPDVASGPLVDWVLQSGLTQEEAALIQPAYAPPPFEATLAQLTTPGAPPVFSQALRFENFSFSASAVYPPGTAPGGIPWPTLCQAIPGYSGCPEPLDVDPTQVGVAARNGEYWNGDDGGSFYPAPGMTDWLFFGADAYDSVVTRSIEGDRAVIHYGFDVSTAAPGSLIDLSILTADPNFNYNQDYDGLQPGGIVVTLRISDAGEELAVLIGDSNESNPSMFPFTEISQAALFSPRPHLRLDVEIVLTGPAQFASLIHEFRVVPEPASLALAGLGLLVLVAARRRSQ